MASSELEEQDEKRDEERVLKSLELEEQVQERDEDRVLKFSELEVQDEIRVLKSSQLEHEGEKGDKRVLESSEQQHGERDEENSLMKSSELEEQVLESQLQTQDDKRDEKRVLKSLELEEQVEKEDEKSLAMKSSELSGVTEAGCFGLNQDTEAKAAFDGHGTTAVVIGSEITVDNEITDTDAGSQPVSLHRPDADSQVSETASDNGAELFAENSKALNTGDATNASSNVEHIEEHGAVVSDAIDSASNASAQQTAGYNGPAIAGIDSVSNADDQRKPASSMQSEHVVVDSKEPVVDSNEVKMSSCEAEFEPAQSTNRRNIDWDALEKPKPLKSSAAENAEFSEIYRKLVKHRTEAWSRKDLDRGEADSRKDSSHRAEAKIRKDSDRVEAESRKDSVNPRIGKQTRTAQSTKKGSFQMNVSSAAAGKDLSCDVAASEAEAHTADSATAAATAARISQSVDGELALNSASTGANAARSVDGHRQTAVEATALVTAGDSCHATALVSSDCGVSVLNAASAGRSMGGESQGAVEATALGSSVLAGADDKRQNIDTSTPSTASASLSQLMLREPGAGLGPDSQTSTESASYPMKPVTSAAQRKRQKANDDDKVTPSTASVTSSVTMSQSTQDKASGQGQEISVTKVKVGVSSSISTSASRQDSASGPGQEMSLTQDKESVSTSVSMSRFRQHSASGQGQEMSVTKDEAGVSTSVSMRQEDSAGRAGQETSATKPTVSSAVCQKRFAVTRRSGSGAKVQPSDGHSEEPAWIHAARRKSDLWTDDRAEEFDRKPSSKPAADDEADEVSSRYVPFGCPLLSIHSQILSLP